MPRARRTRPEPRPAIDENEFLFEGELLVARSEDDGCCCSECFFDQFDLNCDEYREAGLRPSCTDYQREDGQDVIFVRACDKPQAGPHKSTLRGLALPLPK